MNESFINDLAERYGLQVNKRITTGPPSGPHFADFEMSGPRERVAVAHDVARERAKGYGGGPSPKLATVTNPDHPERGSVYIEIQSVWCERK